MKFISLNLFFATYSYWPSDMLAAVVELELCIQGWLSVLCIQGAGTSIYYNHAYNPVTML